MLYYVQYGDTLAKIAKRFNTTVESILNANVICNPNLIFPGEALIVPENMKTGTELPKSGGLPYYVVRPGDTLFCLAKQFNTSVSVLAANNQLNNPNQIYVGKELLVIPVMPNPQVLKERWVNTARLYCNEMSSMMEHGVYFIGTYEWEALGESAIPFLLSLLENPCETVRLYSVMSLARIAINGRVKRVLEGMYSDTAPISQLARLAARKIDLSLAGNKRVHLTFVDSQLFAEPNLNSQKTVIPEGTQVVVLTWNIPSPTAEEGSRGGIQIYDRVQVVKTGQVGFIPRIGFNDPILV